MKGFTLIELLIVIGISAVLSTLALMFSKVGKNQIALSVETAKVSQFILRAKELALATYNLGSATCGYGVEFDPGAGTYSLFAYTPTGAPPCPAASSIASVPPPRRTQFSESTWNVPLAQGVVMPGAADSLLWVLFYPPAPAVFISRSSGAGFTNPAQTSYVHLATVDGSAFTTIAVNPAGQVGF